MLISHHANNVLGEFGSIIPDSLLSFEDVKRTFIRVRALELQKLGISDTDKTTEVSAFAVTAREGALPSKFGNDVMPSGVWWNDLRGDTVEKVEIVPLESIPEYDGSRAIAFYGTPMRYKLSFDAWDGGTLDLSYDPIEDFDALKGTTDASFPPNFLIMLELRSALECIGIIDLKLAMKEPDEFNTEAVTKSLMRFEQRTAAKLSDWMEQFRIWRNKDIAETPRLRRTNDEIYARDYNNPTGARAGDYDF